MQQYSAQPQAHRANFLLVLAYNWLIGGSDDHAKNCSPLFGTGRWRTAGAVLRYFERLAVSADRQKKAEDGNENRKPLPLARHQFAGLAGVGPRTGFSEEYTREVLGLVGDTIAKLAATFADEMRQEGIRHSVLDMLVTAITGSAERCPTMLSASSVD